MKLTYKRLATCLLYLAALLLSFCSIDFVSSSMFEDSTYVALSELEKYNAENTFNRFLLSVNDESFSAEKWIDISSTFDARYSGSSYATIFRVMENVTFNDLNVSLVDITHYSDPFYNFGCVTLLESDGNDFSKLTEGNSIYIGKQKADELKAERGLSGSGYAELFGQNLSLSLEECEVIFEIRGVYVENVPVTRRNFNALYSEAFQSPFFVSRSFLNEYESATIYSLIGCDSGKNAAIFDYLEGRFPGKLSIPSVDLNNRFLVRGQALPDYFKSRSSINFSVLFIFSVLMSFFSILSLRYSSTMLVKIFDGGKKQVAFTNGLILCSVFIVSMSLLVYFVLLRFLPSVNGVFLLKNSLSNWAHVMMTVLAFALLAIALHKRRYLLKVRRYFDNGLLNNLRSERCSNLDTYKSASARQKGSAIVFSRGIDSNSAGGQRAICDSLVLSSLGYSVTLCGFPSSNLPSNESTSISTFLWKTYRGKNPVKRFVNYMSRRHVARSFETLRDKPDVILVYSVLSIGQILEIKKTAKKYGSTLIFDSVEFQNFTEQNFRSFFTYYLPNMFINQCAIRKDDNVIAISHYLETYYKKRGARTTLLPFVNRHIVSSKMFFQRFPTKKRVFLYAGIPGKKDDLFGMIRAFSMLTESELKQSMFLVAGPDERTLYSLGIPLDLLEKIHSSVLFLGRVPYEKMNTLYAMSDFTILLKKSKSRHAKADFPSKVSQSLAHGVPVIANASSDLTSFLVDGEDGFVFQHYDCNEMTQALRRSLSIDDNGLNNMKKNALRVSESSLSFVKGIQAFEKLGCFKE